MTVLVALFIFALFLMQWAGVLLGVGAEMVILVTYLLSLQVQSVGQRELTLGARTVERMALMAIIGSGLAIVAFHVALGEADILFAPAFVAKWILIGVVLFGYKLEQWVDAHEVVGRAVVRGAIGGTWIALLLLHAMAPDTTIGLLIGGYVVWMALFSIIWAGFIAGLSPKPEQEIDTFERYVASELDDVEFGPRLAQLVPVSVPTPAVTPPKVQVAPQPAPVVAPVVVSVVAASAPMPVHIPTPVAPPVIPTAPRVAPVAPQPVQAAPAPHPVVAA
ncbi:MAG TPA: hypothetical protein VIY48_03205, partial [Candidatus Paceibacterota bacterium]